MLVRDHESAEVGCETHAEIEEAKAGGVYLFAGGVNEGVPPVLFAAEGTTTKGGYPWAPPLNDGFTVLDLTSLDEAVA